MEFPGVEIARSTCATTRTDRSPPRSSATSARSRRGAEASCARTGYRAGDRIGKAGVEAAYDAYLRGRHGLGQIRSTRSGGPSAVELRQEPRPGTRSRLTIDVGLQRAAEKALAYGISLAHQTDELGGRRRRDRRARSARRLDPRHGVVADVRAVDLRGRATRRSSRRSRRRTRAEANYPGLNRAPPASIRPARRGSR